MKKIMSMFAAAAVTFTAAAADQYYKPPRVKLVHDGWGFHYQAVAEGQKPDRKNLMTTKYIKDNVKLNYPIHILRIEAY